MANNIFTNYDDKIFAADLVKAFVETASVGDNSIIRTNSQDSSIQYGSMALPAAQNLADGTTLSDTTTTEGGNTLSADSPIKNWVFIPKSALETHGFVNIISNYADLMGQGLREAVDVRLTNLIAKSAAATGGAQVITFDNEAAAGSAYGQAVADCIDAVVVAMDTAKVPQNDRYMCVHPSFLAGLYQIAGFRSGDFVTPGGVDNRLPMNTLKFRGLNITSGVLKFKTDTSADSTLATKYQYNGAGTGANQTYGVAWHKSAVAINYFAEPYVESGDVFQQCSKLVIGRCTMGSVITRSTAVFAITGD